jgi:hypothetical protein
MPVYYFAYGSNLLRERLLERCPGIMYAGRATLPAHRLTFDKASADLSGKCTFEPAEGESVLGVIWRLPVSELGALDASEGQEYERLEIEVAQVEDLKKVLTYRARNISPGLKPYDWYLALVTAGASQQGLPHDYVEQLSARPFDVDPNVTRKTRREALEALDAAGMRDVLDALLRRPRLRSLE